jgi:hypothetical protein
MEEKSMKKIREREQRPIAELSADLWRTATRRSRRKFVADVGFKNLFNAASQKTQTELIMLILSRIGA